jgi:hypothetical protein
MKDCGQEIASRGGDFCLRGLSSGEEQMRFIAVIGIAAIASLPTLVTPVQAGTEYP